MKVVSRLQFFAMISSQFMLGSMYVEGIGVPQHSKKGIKLLKKAAESGVADAKFVLGAIYHEGRRGVPQDSKEAAVWYRLAADQGDAEAQYTLGNMYLEGDGVSEDLERAVCCWRAAAKQGHPGGLRNLACAHGRGHGTEKNILLASILSDLSRRIDSGYVDPFTSRLAEIFSESS